MQIKPGGKAHKFDEKLEFSDVNQSLLFAEKCMNENCPLHFLPARTNQMKYALKPKRKIAPFMNLNTYSTIFFKFY